MWTRKQLKIGAKAILKTNYFFCFFYSFVLFIAVSGINTSNIYHYQDFISLDASLDVILEIIMRLYVITIITFIASVILRIFIGYPLEVSCQKYFIELCKDENKDKTPLLYGFMTNYTNIIATMLLRSVITFLWSLLLIIPGIIKRYTYRFVPYILAESPNMPASEALSKSKSLTKGHKWEMFVLDLSFIGWYLLGALALGLGVFLVNPYRDVTYSELFVNLYYNK